MTIHQSEIPVRNVTRVGLSLPERSIEIEGEALLAEWTLPACTPR